MDEGKFYFIKDEYYTRFPDGFLMQNKETIDGNEHKRPCYIAFNDNSTDVFWLIPISSRTEKFEKIYNNKIEKFGQCDTIVFGEVLGCRKAFLIQNMCPITEQYIDSEYIHNSIPVRIDNVLKGKIIQKAKRVLALQRKGKKLIFPDVLKIESALLNKPIT